MPETKTPTVNAAALREIVPVLYELEAQDRFWMDSWAAGVVNPAAHHYTECGTQFCLAGAKAVYDGWRPQFRLATVWDPAAQALVEKPVATGEFVRPEVQNQEYAPDARDAARIARDGFGLTEPQADFLFYATHISRVADLERRIEFVIAHPELDHPRDHWPEAEIDVEYTHYLEDADRRHTRLAELFTLAELVDNLDEWISKGGFLPHAWARHNPGAR